MNTTAQKFIPTRQSLLNRLRDRQDQASWKDFFETYWKLIYSVARKAGLTDSEAQDVVQETIISVARKVDAFDPAAGSFKGWLMQLTRWRIADQWRKKHYESGGERRLREEPLDDATIQSLGSESGFDLEVAWEQEWHRNLLEVALQKVKGQVSPGVFQLFHLHVVRGIDAKTVAKKLKVKLAEVYYAKYKVSALAKKQIQALEDKMR